MEYLSGKRFPLDAKKYKLYEEVGEGVSDTVYRALCIPFNEIVSIKALDPEKSNIDLDGIRREVNTMTLTDHSNLLQAYCSFTTGHCLWVVMPYMAGGSCLHIMKAAYPEGFEELVIATLLREVLKALKDLVYLHAHEHIHRDVKVSTKEQVDALSKDLRNRATVPDNAYRAVDAPVTSHPVCNRCYGPSGFQVLETP